MNSMGIAIRDKEEILFAPRYHPEKNVGFITTNPKYFTMLQELANQKVFSKMKAEEFQ